MEQTLGTEGDAYLCPDQGIIIVRRVGDLDVERPQVRLLLLLAIRCLFVFFGCATTTSMAQCPMQHRKIMTRSYETHRLCLAGTDLTRVALGGYHSE